jgi:signal transduction histidine kinase
MKKLFILPLLPFSDPAHAWQLQLLRRILAIALGLMAVLLLRDLASGLDPRYSLAAMAVVLTGLLIVRRREHLGRWVGAGLFLAVILVLGWAAWSEPVNPAPVLCFAMLPCTLATLFEGPAFGALVAALTLAELAGLAAARPPQGLIPTYRLVNEGLSVFFGFFTAWAIDYSFKQLQRALLKRTADLQVSSDVGAAMATALFQDLRPLLGQLDGVLLAARTPSEAVPLLGPLRDRLAEARSLYQHDGFQSGQAAAPEDPRQRVIRLALIILMPIFAFVVVRNAIWGGAFWPSLGFLLFIALLFKGLEAWPALMTPAHVNGLLVTAGMISTIPSFINWGTTADSPNLMLPPCLMLLACTLNGRYVITGTLAGGMAMLAWAAWKHPLGHVQVLFLTDLALLQTVLGLVAYSVVQLRQAFHGQLRSKAQALADSLRLRRRLAGTLFHDVNNQLMALAGNLELGDAPGLARGSALAAAKRLCGRIHGLVNLSKDFLLSDQPLDPMRLRSVAVSALFADMEGLFQGRLDRKRQSLRLDGGAELAVLGLPEIVTESILGNLVSNAVKFSPVGATIHVEARLDQGRVALQVRDAGPGIPQGLIDSLDSDGPLPSSPGSDGEGGQGQGLKLVREHLARLGGRLELRRLTQGGTLAVAWLTAASLPAAAGKEYE